MPISCQIHANPMLYLICSNCIEIRRRARRRIVYAEDFGAVLNRRNGFILGLLLCLLVGEIVILAPKEVGVLPDGEPVQKPQELERSAQHTMQGVSSIGSKGGTKEWELEAAEAVRMTEHENWIIAQVKVKFFGNNGVVYVVTGQHGDVDVKKNNMRISGDVVTRSSNGYTFRTEAVFYDSAERRLTSPHSVSMIGPAEEDGSHLTLTGQDLLADLKSNEIAVAKDVHARKSIREGKVATIVSQRALFNGKENSARFIGNVVIDMETLRITGPEARFVYKQGGGTIESMTVDGGVKVTDVDKWATSQRVSVHFEDDRFVFNGSPRVVQSGDELLGDEIVFLQGGREVQVSNANARIESDRAEKASR